MMLMSTPRKISFVFLGFTINFVFQFYTNETYSSNALEASDGYSTFNI